MLQNPCFAREFHQSRLQCNYLYSSLLDVRSTAMGLLTFTALVGGMVAKALQSHCQELWQLDLSFGILCLSTTVIGIIMPETLPEKLPRNLEDVKAMMSVNHAQRIGQWVLEKSALVHKNTVGHI